jgi:anti-sigma regulatory factor (Ser/Thr protein kinase)
MLPDAPSRDDVLTVATELAVNAIEHTASGHGGCFTMMVSLLTDPPRVRLTVADEGAANGPAWPSKSPGPATSGFGLYLVRRLSARVGVSGTNLGRRVWAEITWGGGQGAPCLAPVISRPVTRKVKDGN